MLNTYSTKSQGKYSLSNPYWSPWNCQVSRLRAKTCVYWHGVKDDIEGVVKSCTSCQEHGSSQCHKPSEPLDHCRCLAQIYKYLLVADYYSKFFIAKSAPRGKSPSTTIISMCKNMFSEYGIPNTFRSVNGSQYSRREFQNFAKEWKFTHLTFNSRYPRSNGFIERQVQ